MRNQDDGCCVQRRVAASRRRERDICRAGRLASRGPSGATPSVPASRSWKPSSKRASPPWRARRVATTRTRRTRSRRNLSSRRPPGRPRSRRISRRFVAATETACGPEHTGSALGRGGATTARKRPDSRWCTRSARRYWPTAPHQCQPSSRASWACPKRAGDGNRTRVLSLGSL
jgi:hypothetical protein